jgi:hypothetical protein
VLVAGLSGAHHKPPSVMLTPRLSAPNWDDVRGQHRQHPTGAPPRGHGCIHKQSESSVSGPPIAPRTSLGDRKLFDRVEELTRPLVEARASVVIDMSTSPSSNSPDSD